MTDSERPARRDRTATDLGGWFLLVAVGLAAVALVGTPAGGRVPPFLAGYRFAPSPWLGAAAALAAAVVGGQVALSRSGRRPPFALVQAIGYLTALGWALALGAGRRTAPTNPVTGSPWGYLRDFVDRYAGTADGHPPGAGLLVWTIDRLGLPGTVTVTALGALAVPMLLGAARNICGETAARGFAPILVLAPYGAFLAGATDGVAAALGAGLVAAGARASDRRRTGWPATGWALLAGLLLGLAALLNYPTVWLGGCVVLLYFARRRAFLNLATGLGALVVPVVATTGGYAWTAGLVAARGSTGQSLWWGAIGLLTLLILAGPPVFTSLRRVRNTPAWPCLVGAGFAVAFTVFGGFAGDDVETAWLPFFGWLTIAVTAPRTQAGPPVPVPLLLAGSGALVGLLVAAGAPS
ncbi:hypothetical protein Athai_26060 [Actinocatenispora thailandica]|uniref:Glycosyltransferase RgtA/B/C/D-like domain-containing protein n=1 Tax=Actinocatenispora thailandica TaxID=227318 RepID=A0A7R7HWP5_9ACTN|nr:hypothetical protein [Actinocatenispora thailandica]BCJ35103.1 hypothetical protein Athai_26060 [Actinocatenispora thailandica]